jgi:hypothetical protein
MVCAAVSARISPECIEKIYQVRLKPCVAETLDLNIVVNLISAISECLRGTIIAEKGDMYNLDAWKVKSILGRDFKYPESLGERNSIELAHYISFAGRRLIMEQEDEKVGVNAGNE